MNHDECVSRFVRFVKKTGERSSTVLHGFLVERGDNTKPCYIVPYETFRRNGYRFDRLDNNDIVRVPPEFRRVGVKRDVVLRLFCKPHIDRAKLESRGAVHAEAWKDGSHAAWMSISDVKALPVGRGVKVLVLHRNAFDHSADEQWNPRGKPVAPMRFFRNCIAIYTPASGSDGDGGMRGTLRFANDNDDDFMMIYLEVEYKKGFWYPLDDTGHLPARDPQNLMGRLLGKKVHWTELKPRTTHVGWRGPMLRADRVAKMPHVFYDF